MAGPPDWDLRESDVYVHLIQAVLWRALFVQRGASLAPPSLQPAVSSDAALGDSSALSSAKRKMARRSIAPLSGVFTPTALFKSNRVKGSKLPERLTKRFGDRFADVINGTDLAYRDPAFRNTMAAFSIRYSSRDFQKGFGKKRSIEDLVLLFTAQAQDCMATEAPDTELHQQVNEQVRLFIHLLRDTVAARLGARNYFASSHDLLVRLDSYLRQMDELGAARPHKNLASHPHTLSDASSTATAKVNPLSFASTILTLPAVKLVEVQPLLLTVARLTNTELAQLLKDIDGIRLHWAPKAILSTLKRAHEDVKLKDFNCGNEANFDNYEAWKTWATGEQKDLSERINALYESCPELLQMSTDAARDRHSAVAGEASTASVVPGGEICLIPERSEWVYRCVVQMCFERDLQNIASQAEDEVVELTILSKAHVDLLAQAAEVWRVRKPFSRIMHLQIALDQLSKADRPSTIPAVCVEAILERVEGTVKNEPMSLWTTKEQRLMNETLLHTMRCALTELSFQLHELRTLDLQGVLGWAELVDHIHVDLLDHSTESCGILNSGVDALKDLIRCQGVREYDAIAAEVLAQSPDSLVVVRLHQVCVWLTQRVRKLTKQFPQPLLCRSLNIASLVSEKQASRFWSEMKRRRSEVLDLALHEQEVISFGHLFQLYDDVVLLRETLAKTCTDMPWGLDVPEWFQPHVDQWLVCTSQKTAEWVDNAVRIDTFEPIDSVGAFHSSSIDDLFAALQQPVDFLNGLCWPDGYSLAGFKTSLAKIVSRAIQQYCARIQGMFMTEVLARLPGASKTEAQKQHRVWIARAKQALREKTKVEPFVLQPTTCIKLNNIEKARQLLDTLYNKMDADSHSRIAGQHTFDPKVPLVKLPVTEGTKEPQRYLFTVKVIQADGLLPVGIATGANALDLFVVLTNEKTQTHYARTRTAYDTCEPRWDESFDVTVETPIWLTLTVMERRSGNEEAAFGRTTIKLDPVEFRLMGTQSKVLELDTQGSLLVRIGAEAQHEDILYHFGLAFRFLKRCESNMVHTIVDRIAVFIRQCLSRSTVKSFVRTSTPMGQRLDRMKNLASTSWTAAANGNSETPVASEDAMFVKARTKGVEWTDEEIEQAISPLFVYFESVLATLNESLSPDERLLVLSKIWKQVLMTLQSILMPPLSDKPTDMRPLDERHVAVVMKWRLFLFDYFLARDEETDEVNGLPVDVLRTVKYRELDEFAALNAMTTETLKLEYSRVVGCSRQKQASAHGAERFKSVIHQRSLGTVKERKAQKNFLNDFSTEVVILRILRMRPGTQEFLSQQLSRRPGATAALTPHKESSTSHLGRKLQAKGHQLTASLPQLPSVATMMGTQPSSSPLLGATHGSTPGPSAGYSSARHATGLPLSHARVRSSADPRPPPPPLPLPPRDGHVGERARPALRGARTAPRAPPPLPPRS